jgi:general nucleoside transport system permease protein
MSVPLFRFIENLLVAGVSRGTPLLFASVGEVFCERSGVLNLGVEGMMLVGASIGFSVALHSQSLLLAVLAAAFASSLLALLFGFVAISLSGDQVVSSLGLGFFCSGLASVVGSDLVGKTGALRIPSYELFPLSSLPMLGPAFFCQNLVVYLGYGLVFLSWIYLYRTRWGLFLRAVGENPTAADSQGISVTTFRYLHVGLGGALAGMAGASLSLAITPGWVDGMTSGQGWIAVGLVIFSGWDPLRAAIGSYLFGAIHRLPLDLQGIEQLPFFSNPNLGYFLDMLPYLFTIGVLALGRQKRHSLSRRAPGSLGLPFIRVGR